MRWSRLGVRGKLFVVSLLLIVVVGGASALYLEQTLRGWLHEQVEERLVLSLHTASGALDHLHGSSDELRSLIGRQAERMGIRLTLIDSDGVVVADSTVAPSALTGLQGLAERPEVRAARSGRPKVTTRYSLALGRDMMYLARVYEGPGSFQGVIRASTPLSEVDQRIGRLRVSLGVAGLLGLGLAVFMSWLASVLLSRTLRELVHHARGLAKGKGGARLEVTGSDELGRLAGSFNRLSSELDDRLDQLARERDWLGTVLASLGESVVVVDDQARIERFNPSARGLLRLDDSAVGRPLVEVLRVPRLVELATAPPEEGPITRELSLSRQPPVRVRVTSTPLQSAEGRVLALRDVTEVRRLEKVRSDFVANVSHELRTPVSIMRANAETLLEGALEDPTAARRFSEGILRNADRLSRIISDLLDLSRIEAGQLPVDLELMVICDVARQAAEVVTAAARKKDITLTCEVPETLRAMGDAPSLEQVLVNLLENAVKYTPAGGEVTVHIDPEGESGVTLLVDDNGPGIPAIHRERVFERFYRVDPGRSREVGGTGLGLSIVKHLVTLMGGSITILERPGGGTRVAIRLVGDESGDL